MNAEGKSILNFSKKWTNLAWVRRHLLYKSCFLGLIIRCERYYSCDPSRVNAKILWIDYISNQNEWYFCHLEGNRLKNEKSSMHIFWFSVCYPDFLSFLNSFDWKIHIWWPTVLSQWTMLTTSPWIFSSSKVP